MSKQADVSNWDGSGGPLGEADIPVALGLEPEDLNLSPADVRTLWAALDPTQRREQMFLANTLDEAREHALVMSRPGTSRGQAPRRPWVVLRAYRCPDARVVLADDPNGTRCREVWFGARRHYWLVRAGTERPRGQEAGSGTPDAEAGSDGVEVATPSLRIVDGGRV